MTVRKEPAMDRREALQWFGAAPLLLLPGAGRAQGAPANAASRDLERYIALGSKASGGPGDTACGEWLGEELAAAGYRVERTPFDVPFFEPQRTTLTTGATTVPVIPHAIVVPTPSEGVTGPLFRLDPQAPAPIPQSALVIVDLPRQGWSSATAPLIGKALALAEKAGACGVVLLTNGPTGEAVALNAHDDQPMSRLPTACLAPDDARTFLAGAERGAPGTLTLMGRGGRRPAFNIAGRRNVADARGTVIVSTPRSGWFTCAAERGPGIAVWLDLLRWTASAKLPLNLIFSAHAGHEYENLGLRHQLLRLPKPQEIDVWLMFGAGTVTREARIVGGKAVPLAAPGARSCTVTDRTEAIARAAFTGWTGWSDPSFSNSGGASEAGTAIDAGHTSVIGFNGANPLHHVASDTGSLVDGSLIAPFADACRTLIKRVAGG